MQLRHGRSLMPGGTQIDKVTALAWSPNSRRLAVATLSRIVNLFDENGELKDRFATKPGDPKGSKHYAVTSMVFSSDSTKLAIGQSDEIVFIYKLGLDWGEKKSICNKFQEASSVVSIIWPLSRQQEIFYGLTEGKVKIGQLRTNRSHTVYAHGSGSAVVSLASSTDGFSCLAGHLDGSIYNKCFVVRPVLYYLQPSCVAGTVPLVIAWGKAIAVAGPDCKVTLYDSNGVVSQNFEYSGKVSHEFCSGSFHPSGDTLALGHFGGFKIFSWDQSGRWNLILDNVVENLYTVSALTWNPDGSQLAVGTLCGKLDVFDSCMRRQRYLGKFELTYITKSQVLITKLAVGIKTVIGSQFGLEITKINIYNEQYLVAHTSGTIILGNFETGKISEISWHTSGNEKFLLEHPFACIMYDAGEVVVIEYGFNEVLGTCRTEDFDPSLISLSITGSTITGKDEIKRIAYLIDIQTIRVLDLLSGLTVGTANHTCKIEWLALNPQSTYLLFRDAKRQLHLFNISSEERTMLLNLCTFVQWVPGSDVIVAQNQNNLYVWYTIKNPEQATIFQMKGEVTGIERGQERTEVIVSEGINTVTYVLDEALIEFGVALECLDYGRAVSILESLEFTAEIEAMWKQLAEKSFENMELAFAERCYAALGDVSKARYLHKVNKLIEASPPDQAVGADNYLVKAKLAVLQHQWKIAEGILLDHGSIAESIQMYTECHRWKEAIAVAKSQTYAGCEELQDRYFKWLLQTNQDEEAGKVKETEGDVLGAIDLFLDGGLPGCAAECVQRHSTYQFQSDTLERIAEALVRANMFEEAGKFLELLHQFSRAKDAYVKGHSYSCAIDLARRHFPSEAARLEEEWGDWLVSKRQVDAAISHFIEAGCGRKAIESALSASQWQRAVYIVETQDPKVSFPFYQRLAEHFESTKQFAEAEKFFIQAKLPQRAIEMYLRCGRLQEANKVSSKYLSSTEASALYLEWAGRLEAAGELKEAENLYVHASEYDMAINMYKKARLFDDMLLLVSTYRKDSLNETHLYLAEQLEKEGSYLEAERHYLEAQDWKTCVKMFSQHGMWEDAMRVAKQFGGMQGAKQVAYAWAVSLGGEAGANLLAKLGLVEQALDYALDSCAFDHAFDLCRSSIKSKLPEVHLRFAMSLEDEGRFGEAEDQFIKAGRPREAIDMYLHQQDWQAALRVADLCEPAAISDVRVAQAEHLLSKDEISKAETLFLKAKKPERAINMYKDRMRWEDAIRVAQAHLPIAVSDIHHEMAAYLHNHSESLEAILMRAKTMENNRHYSEAIDFYLQVDRRHVTDFPELQKIWEKAVTLAQASVQTRLPEVVGTIAHKMTSMGKYEEAVKLYEDIDFHREAVDMCITFGLWDQARKVAESDPRLQQFVDEQYKEHLMKKGEAEQLAEIGNVSEAVELYIQQSNWQKVHELSSLLGPDSERESSFRHAKQCLEDMKLSEAVSVLAQYGVPMTIDAYEFCCSLAYQVLGSNEGLVEKMRDILFQLFSNISQTMTATVCPILMEIEKLLYITNYLALRQAAEAQDLPEITAKLSVSLLRYIDVISADEAFYQAGIACKKVGWQNMAFVYLNDYLDIAESIELQTGECTFDTSGLDTSDIPRSFPVPQKHYLEENQREQVRDWLIQLSMDQQVEPVLPTRSCDRCSGEIYEASLTCFYCKLESKPCCVTGYPVLQHSQSCKYCEMPANRSDWNNYIQRFKTCPWCREKQHT
ncbi:intraflagellar transport protein 172 [Selaginella moellendorffii]|uniref:intraflagellar transport protein 172 n=1 Tax=Selaginella moellendorffii TaxID=88036 RepID=UPI000D1C2CCC|nr:intraflagellar transport protein 172 [Selaginella moellendorffii]|eukprot:XP_024531630.1 intraflagellar transport protein 172 [Selaginella moellendorffii]